MVTLTLFFCRPLRKNNTVILGAVSVPRFWSLKEVMTRSPFKGSLGQVKASVIWMRGFPSLIETMVLRWMVLRFLWIWTVIGISTQSLGLICSVGATVTSMVSEVLAGMVRDWGLMVVSHLICGLVVLVVILKVCGFLE